MTSFYKQALCALALTLTLVLGTHRSTAQADNNVTVSYNDFYTDLANYGQWIEDPQYGYVWSPNVDGNFRPYYTNGYWAMTEYGNTWVSDYAWGWACFHYGRWTYDNYYGWLWIPGNTWGPSWVSWRYGDGFYGWAPLGPGYDYMGYADYGCPNDWWVFIPPQYLYTGKYYNYWNGPHGNSTIIQNTTFVHNTYVNNHTTYITGPRSQEVENITHQPVQVMHLANSKNLNTRVHNNVVKMFKPNEIAPATAGAGGERVAPPNAVGAPQPVRTAQPVKATEQVNTTPAFKAVQPRNSGHVDQTGTNVNEVAQPQPRQQQTYQTNQNPYEYDVNRPVTQPRQEPAYQPASRPQMQQQQQAAPQQFQQPQARPQMSAPMAAPQPARAPSPAPARAPAAAPAPAAGRR